ncbi:MAG TPA: polysaccharide pyruvyl transferase family protein, partial [Pseudomonadales bacterium]|nr:polysaccharide pyruvyl transferase family protein [Pseudomonadales bacterium]
SQAQSVFGNPRITVSANWPDEPYFNRADFQVVPSPWAIAGCATKTPVWKQILRTLCGLCLALLAAAGLRIPTKNNLAARWQRLLEAYKKADLVISVSGNQFYSTGKYGWPFPVNILSVELAHIFRKPFYIMPQSIGPLKRGWEKFLLRSAFSKARQLFFREEIALNLAKAIGIPAEKCHYAPDPAFDYPPAPEEEALHLLSGYGYHDGEACIGLTIIASMGRSLNAQVVDRYYAAVADLLAYLTSTLEIKVYIFNQVIGPTVLEDDRTAVDTVLQRMGSEVQRVIVVNESLSPGLLKACYGKMQLFIASRLHSGIFAMGMGVPVLFINYLTKTRGVLDAVGLGQWVIDLGDITGDTLRDAVCLAWQERWQRAEVLAQRLPGIKYQASQVMKEIASDYERRAKD